MNQPLDQTQDINGASRHKLAQLLEFPEFVKTAGMGENVVGDSDTLPQHLYADSAKRLLPCHTKAATWLSTAYFVNSGESRYSAGTREKLASYARYWGITGVEAQLRDQLEKRAAASPESLPDSEFAVVYGDGATKTRKYPLRNAAEVATASGWFRKYAAELTFDDKHTVALKLREKIANHDVTVPEEEIDLLTRCAGLGHCDADSARSIWQKRASLLRPSNPDAADAAEEVAEAVTVASFDVRDVDTRLKMASLLDSFDRMYGLSKWYGEDGGLTPPEEALFFVTEKRAQSMVNGIVKTTTGRLYEKKALYFLEEKTLREWCGDSLADACGGSLFDHEKLAEILPTLPRPEAQAFDRMAEAVGVSEFSRVKTAEDTGLTQEDLRQLADEYASAMASSEF